MSILLLAISNHLCFRSANFFNYYFQITCSPSIYCSTSGFFSFLSFFLLCKDCWYLKFLPDRKATIIYCESVILYKCLVDFIIFSLTKKNPIVIFVLKKICSVKINLIFISNHQFPIIGTYFSSVQHSDILHHQRQKFIRNQ